MSKKQKHWCQDLEHGGEEMLPTTIEATRAVLKADPSLTLADRNRVMTAIKNHGKADPSRAESKAPEPRLIRRADAARRLGCSLRAVDSWARDGLLTKVVLPGRIRAAGFRESDVVSLIQGRSEDK